MTPVPLKKVAPKKTVMRVEVIKPGTSCVPSLRISTVPWLKLFPIMVTCTEELPLTTDPGVTLTICGAFPVKQTLAPQENSGSSARTLRAEVMRRLRGIATCEGSTRGTA